MKLFKSSTIFFVLTISLLSLQGNVFAQKESKLRDEYIFSQPENPMHIRPYSTTLYVSGTHGVYTLRGDEILNIGNKNSILDFEVSPIGNTFAIVDKTNKNGKTKGFIYSSQTNDRKEYTFDVKVYGNPTSVVYSSDSRSIIFATEKGVYIFDTKKFKPSGEIKGIGFTPSKMFMSPNGMMLVAVDGQNATICNFETKKVRKNIDAEVNISDISFSPNSKLMAILTTDGLLSIYDTRTLEVRTMIDDLGDGIACDFNDSGKYIAVITSPSEIELINIVRTSDRHTYSVDDINMTDLSFLSDSNSNPLLSFTAPFAIKAKRIFDMEPYYSQLISESVDTKMNEWLKMQPGESMEEYQNRVNEGSVAKQRRLFEDAISTELAGDLLSMSEISLGNYDRNNGVLAIEFSNLPTILLPVAESDLGAFTSANDLVIDEVQYGILPDDSFELIYAKFLNKNDNKTYVYDNLDRKPMEMMNSDANFVSLDIIRQQQMEEIALQELRQKIVDEAKHNNIISDHTTISLDSRVIPDYDGDGNKILTYIVNVTYQVDPEFSVVEDFAPGKYHVDESGAASSMLKIVKEAFEGEMKQYLKPGKKLKINLLGSADASPILRGIPYDGSYGNFENEPVSIDGVLTPITVTPQTGIKTNPQLALLRASGVKDYITKNVNIPNDMNVEYNYSVAVSKDKGGEYRRITAEFIFPDAF